MKQSFFRVAPNEPLTDTVCKMVLTGDTSAITAPGQFVNIRLDGLFLRRPISVCDYDPECLTLIYKVVGRGTAQMRALTPGAQLDLLTGLGNGYDLAPAGPRPLLLGGGVGVPPLYHLAKELIARGKEVQVVLGFNTGSEIFYEQEFRLSAAPSPWPRRTAAPASRASSPTPCRRITAISTPAARSPC